MKTTRRQLLAGAAGLLPASASAAAKPNLLFVFSDEHRACSMPGQQYERVQAPNLARFRDQSVSFDNCISNYPVCTPYRAMLLTGRWPYQTGMIDNGLTLRSSELSLGEVFRRSGYRTGYIGKWHLSKGDEGGVFIPKGPARQGFDDWHVWSNTNTHFDKSFTFDPGTGAKIQPKGYNCTRMTDTAVEFIRNNRQRPWMLTMSWNPPHPPFGDAPEETKNLYDPATFEFRPNVPKPGDAMRQQMLGYYAHISAVDREFGRLMKLLDETGQANNTIVVYTSDHGEMLGSHGFGGKRLPWDESCKVPFIVRYPGVIRERLDSEALFSTVDIYPSLLALAGLRIPAHCAGKDLSKAMRGEKIEPPESAFLMHIQKSGASGGESHPAPLFRGVRTGRYTYAVADDGRWQLYDNREDPYQLRNRIADPSCAKLADELDGLVFDWLRKAEDPFDLKTLRLQRSSRVNIA